MRARLVSQPRILKPVPEVVNSKKGLTERQNEPAALNETLPNPDKNLARKSQEKLVPELRRPQDEKRVSAHQTGAHSRKPNQTQKPTTAAANN